MGRCPQRWKHLDPAHEIDLVEAFEKMQEEEAAARAASAAASNSRSLSPEQASASPAHDDDPEPKYTAAASSPEPAASVMSGKAQQMAAHLERTGLCVICQDEEANIVVVDCG